MYFCHTVNRNTPIFILFDGSCGLCNASVRLIAKHDHQKIFQFTPLQSAKGTELLSSTGLEASAINSVVVIEGQQHYVRSTAALRICQKLGGKWRLLLVCKIIPTQLRDKIYQFIANRRHLLFSNSESSCTTHP